MTRRNLGITVLAACVLTLLALSPARSAAPRSSQEKLYEQVELLAEAITVIQSDYVEEVDPKKLIYGSLRGLVDSLDRHSQFLDPDAYSEMQVETKGEFGGVGLEIAVSKDGMLTVVAPMDGTPAAKADLHPKDKIVKIDGESTQGISLHEAVTRLRGRPGTTVVLTVMREEESRTFDVPLSRAVIQIRSIRTAKTPADKISYIRISEFQDNTAKDLDRALAPQKELDGLILDLRNNPGGLLDVAVEVSGRFIPEGKTVLSTKGRLANQNQTFTSAFKSPRLDFPMVVLINEGSASASEIVAGALQDHGRAILMGAKSFGKGSVQTVVPLRDGSAVRLTTSIYYTPAGHAIHGKGLEPDVLAEGKREAGGEEEKEDEGEEMADDPVVLRAVDLLKGLSIYGARPQG